MGEEKVDALSAQLAKAHQAGDAVRMVALLGKLEKLGQSATPAAPAVVSVLAYDYSSGQAARAALGAMIPEAVAREVVKALEDDRQDAALDYLDELARETSASSHQEPPIVQALKEVAPPALLALLDREGVDSKALLHPLGMLGPENEQVFARLVELLADPDPDVRYAAPRGLGYFGDRAIPHLEKLLAKHGETGRAAIQGKGPCINVVCETLAAIGTRKAHRALKKAAASGRYGRVPKDLQYLVWKRLHEAETRAKLAELEARRLARLAAPKPSKRRGG